MRIGSGPLPAEIFLGKIIGKLVFDHPKLHINVIVERPPVLLGMLKEREIDIMIGDTRQIDDVNKLEISNLPQYPVCSCAGLTTLWPK